MPRNLRLLAPPPPRKFVPEPNKREVCDGCGLEVAPATIALVQVDPTDAGWKFLCVKCRRTR